MRRTDEEFSAEVYRRGDTYMRKKRAQRKRLITVGTIVLLCAVVLVPVILSGNLPLLRSADKANDSAVPESVEDAVDNSDGAQEDIFGDVADTEEAVKPTGYPLGSVPDEMDEEQSLYIVSTTVNKSILLQVTYSTGDEEGERLFAEALGKHLKQAEGMLPLPETEGEDLVGAAHFREETAEPYATYGGSSFVIQMRDEVTEERVCVELYANGLWQIYESGTKQGRWIPLDVSEAEELRKYLVMWMSGEE